MKAQIRAGAKKNKKGKAKDHKNNRERKILLGVVKNQNKRRVMRICHKSKKKSKKSKEELETKKKREKRGPQSLGMTTAKIKEYSDDFLLF